MNGRREEDRALQGFCYGVGDETATAELELEDGRESEDCLLVSLASIAMGSRGKLPRVVAVRQREGVRN